MRRRRRCHRVLIKNNRILVVYPVPRWSNLDVEKHYFSRFAEDFSLPNGRIEHGDKPDVIVHGARKIGIEIANLYLKDGANPASEQVQRHRREAVLRKAQALYQSETRSRYELTVSFDPSNPILKDDAVAARLAEFACSIEFGREGFFVGEILGGIPEVYSVSKSAKEYEDALWKVAQVYDGKLLSIPRIASELEDKHEKIGQYSACDEYWLLLIVDMMDPAQDQEIDWPLGGSRLRSRFKKVLIYKPQFRRYLHVPIDFIE